MKRLILTLAIAAIGFTGSYAQTKTAKDKLSPEQKAEKSTAKLQKSLALTADQKTKIYAIEVDKFKKAEAWHKESKAARKAQKAKHEALKDETNAKLKQVLTPAQQKQLDAIKAEKKNKKKGSHKGDDSQEDGDTQAA